jgi:DnaJ family protein C protein 19
VYGRPVLRAFGLWQTVKRFTQPNPNSNAPIASVMDKPQARRILEVDDNASREEIVTVLKRLIAKNHQNKGGSTYLASQINQAKDVFLKE